MIKIKLCILMFLQFFVAGATLPIMSLYLSDHLKFTGSQTGLIVGIAAFSAIVSPLVAACIADRLIRAERLLGICHFLGAIVMLFFSRQSSFYPVMFLYLAYTLLVMPTMPLINAITFHHSPKDRRNKFGNIRVWGTIGWIAVAWVFSFGWVRGGDLAQSSRLPDIMIFSALSSLVLSFYTLFLPKGNFIPDAKKQTFLPRDSFKVIRRPEILTLALLTMCVAFIDKFYSVGTSPFLKHIGFADESIMPAMSLGQIPEIFAMGILGFLLTRWGMKKVMILGVSLQLIRFILCSLAISNWMVYTSLSIHGLAYTFVFITMFISLDKYCTSGERAGVHQLFGMLTSGAGGFMGSFTAGRVTDLFTDSMGVIDYRAYWLVPAFIAAVTLVCMILFLKEPAEVEEPETAQLQESANRTGASPG
ncbi:MFS transporter [Chitinispirillales bacterium ANBcel5]|uniref:MFS transporter n=1 Tax=Cellulosispirillum alkaliphilum TaxID=3039283 RepID=UPI002A539820|nr:MFS transporter [Chitinispirillales bacterium ANBcel5]